MDSTAMSRPLPTQLVDQQATNHPERLYCLHPSSQEADCEWLPITLQQLASGVDRLSWWIQDRLTAKNQRVLGYIGTNDLRYGAFQLACMKTGHAALLLSPRNSQPAFRHLLSETGCSVLVDGSERAQLRTTVDKILTECSDLGIERWSIDPMENVFALSPATPPFPHGDIFDEVEDRAPIIIHSSGTTGLPKPVFVTYGYLETFNQMRTLPVPAGRESAQLLLHYQGQMRLLYGAFHHFIGLVCLFESIFYETPFLLAPDRPFTADLAARIMASPSPPRWGLIAPFAVQTVWHSEKGRHALQRLSALNLGGAPAATTTGNAMAAHIRLQSAFGSSETGYTPTLLCEDAADWEWLEWNPLFEHRMDDVGEGLWELVLLRPASRRYHGIFHSYPGLTEYRTGDVFEPHPSKPDLWRSKGRADDVIVLSNGEKVNPIDAENLLETHPLVDGAAVFGQDRFQVALLIEPKWEELPSTWTLDELRRSLEPLLEQANALLPGHGKVHASHIAFATRDRPFARVPKGTLRRRDTACLYEDVLDGLYRPAARDPVCSQLPLHPADSNREAIQTWLQEALSRILGLDAVNLDDDLVNLGIDSLQVVLLAQTMRDAVQQWAPTDGPVTPLPSSTIYDQATARQLAETVFQQIHGPGATTSGTDDAPASPFWPREHRLTHAIWEQAQALHLPGRVVLLTGSTGELGSYILHELLQDPTVAEIYCLSHSPSPAARELANFRAKSLADGWLAETSRVQFWPADLAQEHLGLSPTAYQELRERVDLVIHNAWMVNFNLPLASFATQLQGTRRLLHLVQHSVRSATFHFISSIAVISGRSNVPMPADSIPEALLDSSLVLDQGYAESKYAAEVLCDLVARATSVPITIHRVGQLGGPSVPGAPMWTPRDWFPALIRSSHTMGLIPETLGSIPVDWVPIDIAARAVKQIVFARDEIQPLDPPTPNRAAVYHIVNPEPSRWEPLARAASQACSARIVPLAEWVQSLESRLSDPSLDEEALRALPATQLLGFFTSLRDSADWMRPRADTTNAQRDSAAIRGLRPVDVSLLEVWLRQWKEWIPGLCV